ncbi:MAG: protein kinase [Verrucomicrobia bacterium]|nr:protein kinase [Verrucomicrobiota bacterium]
MATLRYQHYEVVLRPDGKPFELGRGAMGITYKAFDTNLRSEVCLKVINGQFLHSNMARERFLREARAAARLRHPNVASVYHLGQDGSAFFYSMEFVSGETLQARVKRDGVMPARDVLEVALQVSRALAAAQREKLVHRDLKPANIMLVDEYGEMLVKVIDFGLAKATAEEGGEEQKVLTMGFVGTPDYASPEQIEEKPLDTRSDIYSLGATLWYALTGRVMFTGTIPQVMAQQMDRPPPWELLSGQPPELVALLRKMLEKDRDQRPRDPIELRGMIEQALRTVPLLDTGRTAGASDAPDQQPTLAADVTGAALAVGNATSPTDATVVSDEPPPPRPRSNLPPPPVTAPPLSQPSLGGSGSSASSVVRTPLMPARSSSPPPPKARDEIDPDVTMGPGPRPSGMDGPHPGPGVLVARRYKIGSLLTSAPPDDTYLAEDMASGRAVAVRVMMAARPGEAAQRQEILARLTRLKNEPHPHLQNVLAIEPWNGGSLIVLEWPGGATVADRLRARGQLPRPELLHLLEPIAAACDHAAERRLSGLELTPLGISLPGIDASSPFNPSLTPALKVSLFGIQNTPPVSAEEAFAQTMVSPAVRTYTAPPDDLAGLTKFYQREAVGLICELLGRPRPRHDRGHLPPIAALGEEGNAALRRARGEEGEPFETVSDFHRALRSQTFVARSVKPAISRVSSQRIPEALLQVHSSGSVLTLTPAGAAGSEPEPQLPLRLVARDEFRLGRSPAEADLVTWFLPRSPENDELSRRLSKVHCFLRRRGGRLMACDAENSNGTELDGRPLPKNAVGEPIPERGVISLDTRYRVDVQTLPGSPNGTPQIENLPLWTGASSPTSIQAPPSVVVDPTALGGVTVVPRTPLAVRRPVWLLSSLAFGADPALPLAFPPGGNLQPLQGYFHYHLGHFWVESIDIGGGVEVDGIVLSGGEIAPLIGGQRLRLGDVQYQIELA